MNHELLASVEPEVLGWFGLSKEVGTGSPGQGGFLGTSADHLRVRAQGARAHPGHRRGGPHFPEGDLRRADLRWLDEAARGWICGRRELPYSGAGRRAGGRATLPHELRARKSLRREETKSMILVTGASSNVGRHVVSQLLGTGATVRGFARNLELAA